MINLYEARCAEALEEIARHLGVLAEYAEMLRIQASGEKVYEVGSYVLGATKAGDPCLYLYAKHPGLQYRVTTVYGERFAELPFTPAEGARTWDGDGAPSRESAARKGYLRECAPFKVSLLPTGGLTEAGLPVHRFSRVLGGPEPRPAPPAEVAAAGEAERAWDELEPARNGRGETGTRGHGDAGTRGPGDAPTAAAPAPVPHTAPAPAAKTPANGKPVRQATLAGEVFGAFRGWATELAARQPQYQIKGSPGEPDLFHILLTAAALGFDRITSENLAAVQERIAQHAQDRAAQGK